MKKQILPNDTVRNVWSGRGEDKQIAKCVLCRKKFSQTVYYKDCMGLVRRRQTNTKPVLTLRQDSVCMILPIFCNKKTSIRHQIYLT